MFEIMSPAAVRLRLAEYLEARKMTQKKLAELTGLSETSVSKLVGGNPRQIRLDTIDTLCKVLDIEPGDLFEREPDKP